MGVPALKHGPDDIDAIVGLRIRARRAETGISQAKLADVLGVTFQQIQKYETGVNRVSAGRLAALSKALSVPVAYFFKVDEDNQDFELEIARTTDRHSRRLISVFNRVKDETKRGKVVKAIEAIIEVIDCADSDCAPTHTIPPPP